MSTPDAVPTHVARDPASGGWIAVGPDRAPELRRQGWHVVRVVAIEKADHPVRLMILEELARAGEASARDLAPRIGRPLGTVAYHLRTLTAAGAIVLTRTEPRRGALARFYALPGDEDPGPR